MQRSESIIKIATALIKAQSEMSNAKKDAVNPFFKKNYADLNSIREAVLPVLNAHGIAAIQPMCVIDGIYFVETILLHDSGEFISSLTPVINDKPNDSQRHGSGISYSRRYALQSIVNIGAEDDDANAASAPLKTAAPKPKAVTAPVVDPEMVAHYIDNLAKCDSVADMTEYKKQVPALIVADASFIDAAMKRYNLIMAAAV